MQKLPNEWQSLKIKTGKKFRAGKTDRASVPGPCGPILCKALVGFIPLVRANAKSSTQCVCMARIRSGLV